MEVSIIKFRYSFKTKRKLHKYIDYIYKIDNMVGFQ